MFPKNQFIEFGHPRDPYKNIIADIHLDDLEYVDVITPTKLSLITSTYGRYSQLERSLECLCRQDWKEFEVIIVDDGDPVDLTPIFNKFRPFLKLTTLRRERKYYRSDPTGAFRMAFPYAVGEYIGIMQPEMMLWPDVCRTLYYGHKKHLPGMIINPRWNAPDITTFEDVEIGGHPSWVTIKPYFIEQSILEIDKVNWHRDMDNLYRIPDFMGNTGLSGYNNGKWKDWIVEYPWWFVASCHRDNPIWWDMPEYLGHAGVDFYTIFYRNTCHFVDIFPAIPKAVHQAHVRIAASPENEAPERDLFFKRLKEKYDNGKWNKNGKSSI